MEQTETVAQLPQTEKLQIEMDGPLYRHLKAEAQRRGLRGVRPLLEEAIANHIGAAPEARQ